MLISEKTTGSIYFLFFASKEAYAVVRQLEKIRVKKTQAKVVKCAKNKYWVPRNPRLLKCKVVIDKNIKFSRYCPKFHIFTNIVIFQVYLQFFRPTASFL